MKNNLEIFLNVYFVRMKLQNKKIRDRCHLTVAYRGPAHNKCNINITQKQGNFTPFLFHKFSNYDCHLFFKNLIGKKKDKVQLKIIPKTSEENISLTYGCIGFIDRYRFLSSSLGSSVKRFVDNGHKTLKSLGKESIGVEERINYVYEIETLTCKDRTIQDLNRDFPRKNRKIRKSFDYLHIWKSS